MLLELLANKKASPFSCWTSQLLRGILQEVVNTHAQCDILSTAGM